MFAYLVIAVDLYESLPIELFGNQTIEDAITSCVVACDRQNLNRSFEHYEFHKKHFELIL